jgi:hypothetical protein
MHIDGKDIEKLLVNNGVKKESKNTNIHINTFPCLFAWQRAKEILDKNLVR